MSEANLQLLQLAAIFPLSIAAPLLAVWLDFRFLTDEQRARTWPDATYGAAAYVFWPLVLPVHFALSRSGGRTRLARRLRSLLGFVVGAICSAVVYLLNLGVALLLEVLAT